MRDDAHANHEEASPGAAFPSALALHGLWQPVSTLHALALALTGGWPALDDDARLKLARDIAEETARLREVAEDLTTLGALEERRYQPLLRRESIVDLLRDAAGAVDELGGRLRVHVDPTAATGSVVADRARVLQVLKTFLRSAERRSDGESTVTLRADLRGEGAAFFVAYAEAADAARASFDLDPSSGRTGSGSGRSRLSLYLCRRLIEANGGRVEATTVEGVTTLSFVLPIAASEAA
jgi:signal transduction histidine kinase